jgi:hypothetical protein
MELQTHYCPCSLYKQQQNLTWVEYSKPTSLQISPYGLSIREANKHALIGDFPYNSIVKAEIFAQQMICRLHLRAGASEASDVYGVRFHESNHLTSLMEEFSKHSIVCQQISSLDDSSLPFHSSFPNLIDPDVNDYVIQLLFNDDYQLFVRSVRDFLSALDEI